MLIEKNLKLGSEGAKIRKTSKEKVKITKNSCSSSKNKIFLSFNLPNNRWFEDPLKIKDLQKNRD